MLKKCPALCRFKHLILPCFIQIKPRAKLNQKLLNVVPFEQVFYPNELSQSVVNCVFPLLLP